MRSYLASATDADGNFVSSGFLIVISAIVTTVFTVMATVRLWKEARYASIMLASSAVLLFVSTVTHDIVLSNGNGLVIATGLLALIIKPINFIAAIWAIIKLWTMAKFDKAVKNLGLTPEDGSLLQEDLRKGDKESAVQRITTAQERQRIKFKEATGIDVRDIIPEIGREISWADIVRHVFRVFEFDRDGTTIGQNNQVKPLSSPKPYGYLLVESPILNQKVRLPIIHRDDFLLAASVFDEPKLAHLVIDEELLVTYAPKHLLPKGLSGSPHHVLHYVITPRGTLDSYYSINNDIHMANPAPEKLFKEFAWDGEIRVQVNPAPEL